MISWQDPPPYVQYLSEAEQLGRASFDAGTCAGLGVIVSSAEKVGDVADDFVRRAIIARIDVTLLRQSMERGTAEAEEEWKFMFDMPDGLTAAQRTAREDRLVEFVGDRCGGLVADYPAMAELPPE